jgi:ABC-2 type transport system permease protein
VVAVVVGLKLRLLRNGLRRSTWRMVALIIGMLYALGVVVACWAGLLALRFAPAAVAADVTVLGFAVLTIGWLLMSLLVFGTDETVDPRKFALMPVPARDLQPGLFLAGLLGTPGIATVLVTLGLFATWSRGPGVLVATVITVPLGVATCFLLARTGTSAFSHALGSRRFRDFAAVALALVGAGIGLGVNAVANASAVTSPTELVGLLHRAGNVVGWTPVGWIWSVPAAVAAGAWGLAVIKLVLGGALVAGLWAAWRHFLDRSLTSASESGGGPVRAVASGGLADRLFPASPAGAVAARCLRYWRRDPRYLASLGGICVAPIVIIVTQLINVEHGSRPLAAFAPVFLALLLGSVVTNDISYDGSALWLHLSSGLPGAADRAGRAMATAVVIGPIAVIMTVLSGLLSGRPDLLPQTLALVITLGSVGLGVGCWAGSVWQIPVPPPGANPFQRNNSGGLASLASMGASTGLTVLIGLPAIALVVLSFWVGWLVYLAVAVGVITGILTIRAGIRTGGRRLDRRWPEVLTRVTATT